MNPLVIGFFVYILLLLGARAIAGDLPPAGATAGVFGFPQSARCDGATTDVVAFAGSLYGEPEWSVSISMRSPHGRDLLYIESPDKKVFRIAVENGRFVMSGDLPMEEAVRRYEDAHDQIFCPKAVK